VVECCRVLFDFSRDLLENTGWESTGALFGYHQCIKRDKAGPFFGSSHVLRNEVAPRLLDHCRSPQARKAVVDRGFPASHWDSLLDAHDERRTALIDLRLVSSFLDSRRYEDVFLPVLATLDIRSEKATVSTIECAFIVADGCATRIQFEDVYTCLLYNMKINRSF